MLSSLFLLLLGWAMRAAVLTTHQLHPDEALYGYWGMLIVSGRDPWLATVPVYKPPLLPYLIAGSLALWGQTELAVRLPGLFAGTLAVALTGRLAWLLYRDRLVATVAALTVALSPLGLLLSATGFTDPLMVALGLAGCLAAAQGRAGWAGLLVGLAAATKQTGLVWLPLAGLLLVAAETRRGERVAWVRGVLGFLAVLALALDHMTAKGFSPLQVPVLVKDFAMQGTGFYPYGEDQVYRTEKEGLNLVGTAEVPVTALHAGEILREEDLPLRYVARTFCFRREAGAAGRDTRGLYRVHQFEKVEQVVLCRNDRAVSDETHLRILENAEELVRLLELPYRVVDVCGGDLGLPQARKFDIEVWMPSREAYGETHSASKFYDFQARRLRIRYKDPDRRVHFVHTLNNTVAASPRILIPLLEIHQTREGTVRIPVALRPYMKGMEEITPC